MDNLFCTDRIRSLHAVRFFCRSCVKYLGENLPTVGVVLFPRRRHLPPRLVLVVPVQPLKERRVLMCCRDCRLELFLAEHHLLEQKPNRSVVQNLRGWFRFSALTYPPCATTTGPWEARTLKAQPASLESKHLRDQPCTGSLTFTPRHHKTGSA